MRNHDQKAKDMAESVLPSTMYDSRRERRAIHGRHRARQHVQLRRLSVGTTDDFDPGLERLRAEELKWYVQDPDEPTRSARSSAGPAPRSARTQRSPLSISRARFASSDG